MWYSPWFCTYVLQRVGAKSKYFLEKMKKLHGWDCFVLFHVHCCHKRIWFLVFPLSLRSSLFVWWWFDKSNGIACKFLTEMDLIHGYLLVGCLALFNRQILGARIIIDSQSDIHLKLKSRKNFFSTVSFVSDESFCTEPRTTGTLLYSVQNFRRNKVHFTDKQDFVIFQFWKEDVWLTSATLCKIIHETHDHLLLTTDRNQLQKQHSFVVKLVYTYLC